MKKILLIIGLTTLLSCSDEKLDANQNTDEIRFLPKKIVFSDDARIRTYTFSYDGNKIISANQKIESLSYNTDENGAVVTYKIVKK